MPAVNAIHNAVVFEGALELSAVVTQDLPGSTMLSTELLKGSAAVRFLLDWHNKCVVAFVLNSVLQMFG